MPRIARRSRPRPARRGSRCSGLSDYHLHVLITILLWSFIYTAWSIMGRFGLVSLGHGAFLGIGAYGVTMLWNHYGLSPWLGIPIALALAGVVAAGDRLSLLSLPHHRPLLRAGDARALGGGAPADRGAARLDRRLARRHAAHRARPTARISLAALQFADKEVWFYIMLAFWLVGLWIWRLVDRSMARSAMQAISQEEDAAASVGINVTRTKLGITLISAAMTAMGGALYGQYQMYINPETVSGIAISLQIVFAVIAGGMFVQLGPTVGALITLLLAESLRVLVGHEVHGLDGTIYGLMLVLFIIYMPKGILGKILELWERRRAGTPPPGRLRPAEAAE